MSVQLPTVSRRERKKLETRNRIFSAALELFVDRGFEATSVEEIAKRADVGKGTVFNYFPKKTSFLGAAYQRWLDRLTQDLGPVETWEGSAHEQLERMFNYLVDLSMEHRALSRLVIFESMRQIHLHRAEAGPTGRVDGPDAMEEEGFRLLENITRQVIRRGKDAGEIRPEVQEGPAASVIAATAFHTLIRWLTGDGSAESMKVALSSRMDIIFKGMDP